LREEKAMEKSVDLQESLAGDPYLVPLKLEPPLLDALFELLRKVVQRIFSVFVTEVLPPGVAEFELQDEFADKAFFVRGGIGAEDGELAPIDLGHVGTDIRLVLVVHSPKVPEAGHPGREKIGARPETVAVDESGRFG